MLAESSRWPGAPQQQQQQQRKPPSRPASPGQSPRVPRRVASAAGSKSSSPRRAPSSKAAPPAPLAGSLDDDLVSLIHVLSDLEVKHQEKQRAKSAAAGAGKKKHFSRK